MKKFGLILLIFLYACAHGPVREKTAEELFHQAQQLANKNKAEEAVDTFMKVRTFYPGDELAKRSLLSIADLYSKNKDYATALDNYKEFMLLYPTDPDTPYCLFKIGMSHFKQMCTYDRDQSETVKAVKTFKDLMEKYPASPYVKEGRIRLRDARIRLARHYIYIGKFYLRDHKYKAACRRFNYIRKNYSGLGLDKETKDLISKSCGKPLHND